MAFPQEFSSTLTYENRYDLDEIDVFLEGNFSNPMFFSTSGLGVEWSAPGPDAMYLAFTFVYIVSGMIFHRNYNWFLMSGLLVLLISNGFFRMKMRCVQGVDIGIGYLVGAVCAIGWYFLMAMFESSAFNNKVSLTYFNDVGDDGSKCTLTKKKFKCRKITK